MQGLEPSKKYYEAFGEEMLRTQFPELLDKIAVGLAGSGSECFGFDDESSRDHDFEPGFCIFLPGEDSVDRRTAFLLQRAYDKLPREFEGCRRSLVAPVGGRRNGVMRTAEFYEKHIGLPRAPESFEEWLAIPEYALAEATNGAVVFDGTRDAAGSALPEDADPRNSSFTAVRAALLDRPEDVRLKLLAGCLLLMAQSGQYNYPRCLGHGETAAAQLALFEFVRNALHAVFLLNRRYMPFYKWSFRALKNLPILSELDFDMELLISTPNDAENADFKALTVERIAGFIIGELERQAVTAASCGDLEKHAYSVNDGIADAEIRNLHILAAVSS